MPAYIEKVIVEGFKSYGKERKEIPLGKGFIAIVGPNGAGKSNIGDAISFALGLATTKTLRAKNLSYLIFSKDGEKAPYAYVEVHFINDGSFPVEDEKVIISRKVNRDGKSTFRINGVAVRERDLKDFLAKAGIYENGYNIVLQGDIIKFLRMTPAERRKVIEDVAGISEYEEKKEKAIKDLAEVEVKIRELKIILDEIEERLEKLKKEKEKLEKFKELQEERKKVQIYINLKELRKLEEEERKLKYEINNLEEKLKSIKREIEDKEERLKKEEEGLKRVNENLLPFKERIGKLSTEIGFTEKEIRKKEKLVKDKKEDIEREERTLEYLYKDLESLKAELSELEKKLEEKEKEYREVKEKEEKIFKELKSLDEKLKVSIEEAQKTEEKEKKLKELIDKNKDELNALRLKLKEISLKIERTEESLKNLEKEEEDYRRKVEEYLTEVEKYRRTKAVEQDILKKLKEEQANLERKLKEIRSRIEEVIKTKAYIESKIEASENIASAFDGIEGVYGTVGDLISVKDPEHIRAIEIAGGGRLRYVVVENEDVAKRCIDILKEKNLGRMSFIPLNRIRTENRLPPYPRVKGAIDFAVNLIEYDPKFENVVRFVFGDTLIVEDYESAKRIGIGNYRMVTLEGELFEKSGVITGGSLKTSGELGRKFYEEEKKKLEEEEEKLRKEEEEILNRLKAVRSEIAEKEGVIKVLEKKISEYGAVINEREGKEEEFRTKKEKGKEYIKILEEQKREIEEKIKMLEREIEYAEEKLKNLTLKRQDIMNYYRSSGIEEKRKEYERTKKISERLREEIEKLNIEKNTKTSEIERIEEEIRRKIVRLEDLKEELESLKKEIENLKIHKEELKEKIKLTEAEVYELYKEKDKLEENIKNLQSYLGRLRMEEEGITDKLTGLKGKYEVLLQKIEDVKNKLKELGFEGDGIEVRESVTKLKEKLGRIEEEIKNLGEVNFKAEEDYNSELSRFKDYEEKYKKLIEEKQAIKNMIEEIETKKLKAFMEAFKNINRNLKKIFSYLSPGGKAQMILENEADPFSGGINLVVKPRGKDVQYLEAMSGGEKTLAALSLIFAIQEYKPSPFYYFDEVDAHLDEANARKVGELIKEKSKEAQFIVVTLREVLASFADRLIGVTARGGVSYVFPVNNLSGFKT